jgi:hypothetical protein
MTQHVMGDERKQPNRRDEIAGGTNAVAEISPNPAQQQSVWIA